MSTAIAADAGRPPAPLSYLQGFGNHFVTEAVAGALPEGRNSPQRCPYGLYAEQFSGTAFTAPRHANRLLSRAATPRGHAHVGRRSQAGHDVGRRSQVGHDDDQGSIRWGRRDQGLPILIERRSRARGERFARYGP